jgi:hypothetical protein
MSGGLHPAEHRPAALPAKNPGSGSRMPWAREPNALGPGAGCHANPTGRLPLHAPIATTAGSHNHARMSVTRGEEPASADAEVMGDEAPPLLSAKPTTAAGWQSRSPRSAFRPKPRLSLDQLVVHLFYENIRLPRMARCARFLSCYVTNLLRGSFRPKMQTR